MSRQVDWSNRFFHDRRMLLLFAIVLVVAGLSSVAVMPRMEDPVLTKRVAIITTRLPGADARRVEALVTQPLEDYVSEISAIKELRSESRPGISVITVDLIDTIYDSAPIWSELRGKIENARGSLPSAAGEPLLEDVEARAYALILSVVGTDTDAASLPLLRRVAADLEEMLSVIPGTDKVDLFGDPGEEVTVTIDPQSAASLGIDANSLANQLARFDAKESAGVLRGDRENLLVEIDNQFRRVAEIAATPIRLGDASSARDAGDAGSSGNDGARTVRLDQIASVHAGVPDPAPRLALSHGRPAIGIGAMVREEMRIDRWATAVEERLRDYRRSLPQNIEIETVMRQSRYVEQRLASLGFNLAAGALAVTLVSWLLMGWRSAVVVALTLPLCSLGVLAALQLYGVPLHQMSITGLIIALGLLIDNAIVVCDEIRGRVANGMSASNAVSETTRRLAMPLTGSTLTTVLAFAPISLMPGPAGEFVGSIAISVQFAVVLSLVMALTMTGAVAGILMSSRGNKPRRWYRDGIVVPALAAATHRLLIGLYHRPLRACLLAALPAFIGFLAWTQLQEQFFPPSDREQFYVHLELPVDASIHQTIEAARRVDEALQDLDPIRVDWFFGDSGPTFYYNVIANRRGMPNYGQAIVRVPPQASSQMRTRMSKLQQLLREELPGAIALVRQLEQGPPFNAPIELRVFGNDLVRLAEVGEQVATLVQGVPQVVATRRTAGETVRKASLRVDPEAARMVNLQPRDISTQLAARLDGSTGGVVLEDTEQLPLRVRVGGDQRRRLDALRSSDLIARDAEGRPTAVPVATIVDTTLLPETATIMRFNRRRMVEVSGFLMPGVLPSATLAVIKERIAPLEEALPQGFALSFAGEASKRNDAIGNLLSTVLILMVLMVTVLVLALRSFRSVALIGCVGTLSLGMGMIPLWLAGYPFGFMAIIGSMGLVGIAINDSIVVLTNLRLSHAATPEQAAHVVMHDFRHILATTLTSVVGFMPLIILGGEFWPPLAIAIAGGVTGATLLALVFVPAAYLR